MVWGYNAQKLKKQAVIIITDLKYNRAQTLCLIKDSNLLKTTDLYTLQITMLQNYKVMDASQLI